MKTYVDYVYDIIKEELEFFDAMYEDHIIELVGSRGFNELIRNRLLETCGAMADRQLYVLVDKK